MRLVLTGLIALPVLAACETFDPYSVEYKEILQDQGVSVYSNLMEDFSGSRWVQFTASNAGGIDACVQIRLTGGNTSGHKMGDTYRLEPGATIDIGYVNLPGRFDTSTQVWNTEADGSCGYPPS